VDFSLPEQGWPAARTTIQPIPFLTPAKEGLDLAARKRAAGREPRHLLSRIKVRSLPLPVKVLPDQTCSPGAFPHLLELRIVRQASSSINAFMMQATFSGAGSSSGHCLQSESNSVGWGWSAFNVADGRGQTRARKIACGTHASPGLVRTHRDHPAELLYIRTAGPTGSEATGSASGVAQASEPG